MSRFAFPPELAKVLFLIIVFAAVVCSTVMVVQWFRFRMGVRRRLAGGEEVNSLRSESALRSNAPQSGWVKLVNAVERAGVTLVDTQGQTEVRTRLIAAGFRSREAPRIYELIRLAFTLGMPALLLTLLLRSGSDASPLKLFALGSASALLGRYLPSLFISARASRRRNEILRGFPDALDLMLVCVEAGLGLDAAFGRVGKEMARSHPLLSELMATLVLELRAGMSRDEALRRMSDRAGVEEISAFTTLLIQSSKLGSSIGQTLRIYSSEMREKRRLKAEEKAHRLPALLSIPLVTCMLPAMIGVLMLPSVIRVMRVLLPALQRGH